jgi:hypothetical protein
MNQSQSTYTFMYIIIRMVVGRLVCCMATAVNEFLSDK